MSSPAERIDKAAADRGPLRFVSAASLFDGHDAAINIIRRILQAHGAEVVHLGHNRSVADIVRAAIQEDADGIAVSSYQGGHNEYFRYMVDMLKAEGATHIRVVVGGGGTIAPHEVEELEAYGIEKIYTPDDGQKLGLDGMIEDVFRRVRASPRPVFTGSAVAADDPVNLARAITLLEQGDEAAVARLRGHAAKTLNRPPVLGITGTGGAGKSSLTDEILIRIVRCFPDRRVAVVAMDPTRRRSGGALLGDRIRMNALAHEQLFMRSLATRRQHLATSAVLADTVQLLKSAGFDLIVVETAGIGQSDTEIVDLVDVSMYVMTADYGAASQLEKIDMLDFADFVVLNKFEKRGAEDALRDVRKQVARNRKLFKTPPEELPVYPTIASQFNDAGVNALFSALCVKLHEQWGRLRPWQPDGLAPVGIPKRQAIIPGQRVRYLAEIAAGGRGARHAAMQAAEAAARAHGLYRALARAGRRLAAGAARPLRRGRPRAGGRIDRAPAPGLQPGARRGRHRGRRAAQGVAGPARGRLRPRVQLPRAGPRGTRAELQRVALAPAAAEDRDAAIRGLGRAARVPADREPAGRLPIHRRHLSLPPRGRGPDAHVRGRGHAGAHEPALPLPRAWPPGDAAVDRLRLDDALRRGPRRAAGHLRPHRQFRRVDRLARRHEAPVLRLRPVRALDLGVDDDQRPGADDPRDVHEHRRRPAGRAVAARERPLGRGARRASRSCSRAANAPAIAASSRPATTAPGSACSASAAMPSSTRRPTRVSAPMRSRACAARCRPTSSRRTRRRTPASSRPSSRSG